MRVQSGRCGFWILENFWRRMAIKARSYSTDTGVVSDSRVGWMELVLATW